jgi:hypothetical protein
MTDAIQVGEGTFNDTDYMGKSEGWGITATKS